MTPQFLQGLFLVALVVAASCGLILASDLDPVIYSSALFLPLSVLLAVAVKESPGV